MAKPTDPDRTQRHQRILEILRERDFKSQSEVAAVLSRAGFKVTQASVSRDFQELGVIKSRGCYRVPFAPPSLRPVQITSVSAGENLLVIRTGPGEANAIALRIDQREISGVVGTVAGDDTVFVATKDKKVHKVVVRVLSVES